MKILYYYLIYLFILIFIILLIHFIVNLLHLNKYFSYHLNYVYLIIIKIKIEIRTVLFNRYLNHFSQLFSSNLLTIVTKASPLSFSIIILSVYSIMIYYIFQPKYFFYYIDMYQKLLYLFFHYQQNKY